MKTVQKSNFRVEVCAFCGDSWTEDGDTYNGGCCKADQSAEDARTTMKARNILKKYIQPDGGLYDLEHYMMYQPGDKSITLDDEFDVEELEAIVWWIRNTGKRGTT